MTKSPNNSLEALPKKWRYNARELRMEHSVPCYDENEEYEKHVWVALVPDDISQHISELLHQQREEIIEMLEGMRVKVTDRCRHCNETKITFYDETPDAYGFCDNCANAYSVPRDRKPSDLESSGYNQAIDHAIQAIKEME